MQSNDGNDATSADGAVAKAPEGRDEADRPSCVSEQLDTRVSLGVSTIDSILVGPAAPLPPGADVPETFQPALFLARPTLHESLRRVQLDVWLHVQREIMRIEAELYPMAAAAEPAAHCPCCVDTAKARDLLRVKADITTLRAVKMHAVNQATLFPLALWLDFSDLDARGNRSENGMYFLKVLSNPGAAEAAAPPSRLKQIRALGEDESRTQSLELPAQLTIPGP